MSKLLLTTLVVGMVTIGLAAEEKQTSSTSSRAELEQRYVDLAAEQAKYLDHAKLEGLVASLERYNREMAAHKRLLESVERMRKELEGLQEQFPGTMAAQQAESMQKSLAVQRVPVYSEVQVLPGPPAWAEPSNTPAIRHRR